jgi:hypothetical protein
VGEECGGLEREAPPHRFYVHRGQLRGEVAQYVGDGDADYARACTAVSTGNALKAENQNEGLGATRPAFDF